MKRLAFAALVAGSLFFIFFSAEKRLEDICVKIDEELEICAEYIKNQNYDSALGQAGRLEEFWRKNRVIMDLISGDDSSLLAERDVFIIVKSIDDENYAYALLSIRECQRLMREKIVEGKLSINNIL